jgi:hypothetical protein
MMDMGIWEMMYMSGIMSTVDRILSCLYAVSQLPLLFCLTLGLKELMTRDVFSDYRSVFSLRS